MPLTAQEEVNWRDWLLQEILDSVVKMRFALRSGEIQGAFSVGGAIAAYRKTAETFGLADGQTLREFVRGHVEPELWDDELRRLLSDTDDE